MLPLLIRARLIYFPFLLLCACSESLHGNIILAMGISTYEERLAIVMELLDGDLDTLLIKNAKEAAAKLSLYQRLFMARDAALGMNWLHSREPAIIHR